LIGFGIALGLDSAKIGIPVDAVRMILMNDVLHLLVGPQQVLRAVITFTVIAGLAAVWPAFRASRMQPVTAIQHVT
jgi:ABC-type antimicrobial peptide transport system permease subunit